MAQPYTRRYAGDAGCSQSLVTVSASLSSSSAFWAPEVPDYTFAFQPIIDVVDRQIYSYEALVRGLNGEPAATVLQGVRFENLHDFDLHARVVAVDAQELG